MTAEPGSDTLVKSAGTDTGHDQSGHKVNEVAELVILVGHDLDGA
jgi:hypothetical protein